MFLAFTTVLGKAELNTYIQDCTNHLEEMESVTQYQQLQHVPVSRKRRNEQGDNGCSGRSKKPKENTETTKADLEDGTQMTIEVEQVTVLSQQCISTRVRKIPSLFSCSNNSVVLLSF